MAHGHMHRVHARENWLESIAGDAASALGAPGIFQDSQPSTVVSYVYVTKSKTFSGDIAGYSTSSAPTTTEAPKTTSTHTSATALVADTSSTHSSSHTTLETSTGLPQSITPPSSTDINGNGLVVATSSATDGPSSTALSTNTASTTAVAKSSGMSAGGEAGLAIGILCLVGTIAGLVFFFYKKRRDANRERIEDEKSDVWGGAERMASTRTNPIAPRLSLRPVTQFLPNLAGERRQSRNALAMAGASPAGGRRYSWETPVGPDANRNNPFGNHAEAIDAANANGPPVVEKVSPRGEIIAASAAGAAAGGAALLTRGASKRENGPKQMDFTTKNPMLPPVSPVGTEFSMSSEPNGAPTPTPAGAAIAAAGGPVNSTVHRVQLDFKPSMDDELELRAGQLIRLLHEYDDGWVSSPQNCTYPI
jgi:hypothetical protein